MGNLDDLAAPILSKVLTQYELADRVPQSWVLPGLARTTVARMRRQFGIEIGVDELMSLGKQVLGYLMGGLDACIAVSGAARDFATSYGVAPGEVIPNGVDVAAFESAAGSGMAPRNDRPTVLFFSRLDQRKGLDTLLDAMPQVARRVPGTRLIVAGNFALDDPQTSRYRDMAERLAVDCDFLASPSDEEKISLFMSATALCAPATGQESFGIILAEALAAGLPIVASDLPGYRAVLEDGRLGLLVPPSDAVALADALSGLLGDEQLRERLSAAGAVAVKQYAWEVVARRTADVYAATLAA